MDLANGSVDVDDARFRQPHVVAPIERHEEPIAGETLDAITRRHDADARAVRVLDVDVAPAVGAVPRAVHVVSVLGPTVDDREGVLNRHG